MQKHQTGTAEDSIQRTEMYLKHKLKGGVASKSEEEYQIQPLYRPVSSKHEVNSERGRLSFNEDLDEEEFHLNPPNLSYRPLSSKNLTEREYVSPFRAQSSDEFFKPSLPNINATAGRQYSANSADQEKQSNAEVRLNMSRIRNSNSKSDNNIMKSSKNRALH
mgnify:CR=1 FL=1|jgi:hypothetical protein